MIAIAAPERGRTDLIRQLADARLEELCHHLLPNGRKQNHRWVAGSVTGEPGNSFDVNLMTGVFGDWAADQKMQQGAINLWMTVRKVPFKDACRELAEFLSIPIGSHACQECPAHYERFRSPYLHKDCPYRIQLPRLETPTVADFRRLSESRSIEVAALRIASDRGFLWCFDDKLNGRCWIFTDKRRHCAIRRRLDNRPFRFPNGTETKAAACPGSNMRTPLGYAEAIPYPYVAVTEGAPDAVSALAHAYASGLETTVAVVCMPSINAAFTVGSLVFLKGKRARIFTHNDTPGQKAAARWAVQLRTADIEVDGFTLRGLTQNDGTPVSDLNDFLRIDPDCWEEHRARVDSVMDFALGQK